MIQGYLDKIAALRKRREVLSGAIELIRAGDDEIMKLPVMGSSSKAAKPRVVDFDKAAVELNVLELLTSGPMPLCRIRESLDRLSVMYSLTGLKDILNTSPKIKRTGVREAYSLVEHQSSAV